MLDDLTEEQKQYMKEIHQFNLIHIQQQDLNHFLLQEKSFLKVHSY